MLPDSGDCSSLRGAALLSVVAPVEQSIDQVEEAVKQEHLTSEKDKFVKDFDSDIQTVCKKSRVDVPVRKAQRCRKQRLVPRDIFS